ncbi:hypothetical protein ACGP04_02385 [Piscirickettsia salmonis]|uniref:hypothetical protein n=1 Tax=Piscirickettsia salmonis TaxID=1238 RepID=UPI0037507ECD
MAKFFPVELLYIVSGGLGMANENSRVQEESELEVADVEAPAIQMFDGETIVEFGSGGVEDDFDPGSAFEAQSDDLIQDTDLAIRLDNCTPEEIAAFFSDSDNKTSESSAQSEVKGRERSGTSADITGRLSGASEPRKRASAKADIAGGLSGAFGVRGRADARADSVEGLSGVIATRERSCADADTKELPDFANNDSGHVGSYATTGIFLAESMAEEGASSSHALSISGVEFDYD